MPGSVHGQHPHSSRCPPSLSPRQANPAAANLPASAYTRPMSVSLLYAAAGLLVGAMVGLTGVGGGSLMTPILMLLFGQSPSVAVGTDLLFAATTKLVATASFGFSRRVDWPIVGRLLLGSIPGSAAVVIGLWLARRAPLAAGKITLHSIAIILLV